MLMDRFHDEHVIQSVRGEVPAPEGKTKMIQPDPVAMNLAELEVVAQQDGLLHGSASA